MLNLFRLCLVKKILGEIKMNKHSKLYYDKNQSIPAGHICKCRKKQKWPAYVYAHYHVRLSHICENCNNKTIIFQGEVNDEQ
jgi:hypothetical protein